MSCSLQLLLKPFYLEHYIGRVHLFQDVVCQYLDSCSGDYLCNHGFLLWSLGFIYYLLGAHILSRENKLTSDFVFPGTWIL